MQESEFILDSGTVKPETSKTASKQAFQPPKTKKEVRSFLGITAILPSIHWELLHDCSTTYWSHEKEFSKQSCVDRQMWQAIQRAQEVTLFCTDSKESDFECQLILQTDALDRGVGAVLSQRSDDGHEHPIAYWSENLLPREQRYSKLGVAAFRCTYLVNNLVLKLITILLFGWRD